MVLPATATDRPAFAALDWGVLLGYFALLALTGYLVARRQPATAEDYFLGSRRMPVWAVICSLVATVLSAATFIGAPQITYEGNLTYLAAQVTICAIIAVTCVAVFFIPAYYRHHVTTVYELIEVRIGGKARRACSAMFMVGKVFSGGARLFMVAIPASLILFNESTRGEMILAIAVLTLAGIFYTLVGGVSSVIWTDVLQLIIFTAAAAITLGILFHRIPADAGQMLDALRQPDPAHAHAASKLIWADPGFSTDDGVSIDFARPFSLLSAFTGLALLNIAAYGTDHDLAQRLLTCRNSARGSLSALGSVLVSVPVQAIFLAVGLLLFIFYKRPDVMGALAPAYVPDGEKVFIEFILREMPMGMRGMLLAGLFAAGLSTLNSALNSMAATTVADFYRPLCPDKPAHHYVAAGRIGMIVWGVVLGLFAALCVALYDPANDTLIKFALGVMVVPYSGLLAVFATAVFTRRGNNASAIAALAVGAVIAMAMDPAVAKLLAPDDTPAATSVYLTFIRQIAFPWRMLTAFAAALLVSLMGRRRQP